MKQLFTLFLTALFALSLQAQVSLTEAPDFTVTDIHGESHNLYSILDQGKYVMVDLYAYWCGPCCNTAPSIKQTYLDFGCNTADLYVIGLEADGTLAQTEDFELNCGSEGGHPVASGLDGGGSDAVDAFAPAAFPTIILIAPDRSIVEQDIWPYTTSGTEALLNGYGIQKAECAVVSNVTETAFFGQVEVSPNPFSNEVRIAFELNEAAEVRIDVLNLLGQSLFTVQAGDLAAGAQLIPVNTAGLAEGTYFVRINAGEHTSKSVKITK